jgi:hypothetical protein
VADDPWDRTEHFGWEDSFAEMRVLVPIAPHVTSRHICVNISSTRLVVSLCSGRGAVADWDAGAAGEGAGEERAGAGAGEGTVVDVILFASVDVGAHSQTYTQ